jgi:hypothetical protein
VDDLFGSSAFGAALLFGFRHGFDWDHIAALTDLGAAPRGFRRSMVLATLYVAGHAAMVLVLGVVAIVFADQLPDAVDGVMERLVGVTLVALGVYVIVSLVRGGNRVPRSRGMLLWAGLHRLAARRRARQVVVVEHSHGHDHAGGNHDHDHDLDGTGRQARVDARLQVVTRHAHLHRHEGELPDDPFPTYSALSSFVVGVLHGVGAETPTQVLVFATAANVSDTASGIALLVCFLAGVVVANTLVAAGAAVGFAALSPGSRLNAALAVVTAVVSLGLGLLYLLGRSAVVPVLAG